MAVLAIIIIVMPVYPTIQVPAYQTIQAEIDIDPDTLNLRSKGCWITCYIELPDDYNVSDIDVGSILLNGTVSVAQRSGRKGGYFAEIDDDELMVKFERAAVQSILSVGEQLITVTGKLNDGTMFEGTYTIEVINRR